MTIDPDLFHSTCGQLEIGQSLLVAVVLGRRLALARCWLVGLDVRAGRLVVGDARQDER